MATKVQDYNTNAASNSSVVSTEGSTNIAEGMSPAGVNNAIRGIMQHIKQALSGADDSIITGTIGPNGNYPQFNDDGDIIDSGVAVGTVSDNTVSTAKLTDGSITEAKVAVGAVTETKIGAGAVTTAKVADGAVTAAKVASGTLVTESEGIASNDNDTTLPTSAAVKDYVDNNASAVTYGTPQATTSGTTSDFTGIPSTATQIDIMLNGVSLDGNEEFLIQIGDSGGFETTGYLSRAQRAVDDTSSSNGFVLVHSQSGATEYTAKLTLTRYSSSSNLWFISGHNLPVTGDAQFNVGSKELSGTLDRIRLTSTNTPDTFDAGQWNIRYS